MAQVLVRGLESETVEKLKARARQHGRSLSAELRLILEDAAAKDWDTAMAEIKRVQALFRGQTFPDSTELIRKDRQR